MVERVSSAARATTEIRESETQIAGDAVYMETAHMVNRRTKKLSIPKQNRSSGEALHSESEAQNLRADWEKLICQTSDNLARSKWSATGDKIYAWYRPVHLLTGKCFSSPNRSQSTRQWFVCLRDQAENSKVISGCRRTTKPFDTLRP